MRGCESPWRAGRRAARRSARTSTSSSRRSRARRRARKPPKVFDVEADKIDELTVQSRQRRHDRAEEGRRPVADRRAGARRRRTRPKCRASRAAWPALENVRASSTRTPTDLAAYGLAEPARGDRLQGGGREGVHGTCCSATRPPTGGELYAQRGGEKKVFLVPAYLETSFDKTHVRPARQDAAGVRPRQGRSASTIEAAPGSRRWLAKAGGEWKLEKPVQAPADYGTVEALIGRLQTAQMKSIAAAAGRRPEAVRPRQAGGRRSRSAAGSARATLLVGGKDAGRRPSTPGTRRARSCSPSRPASLDELKKPADDCGSKDVFEFRPFNATEIEIDAGSRGPGVREGQGRRQGRRREVAAGQRRRRRRGPGQGGRPARAALEPAGPVVRADAAAKTGLETPALRGRAKFDDGKKEERVASGGAAATCSPARAASPAPRRSTPPSSTRRSRRWTR